MRPPSRSTPPASWLGVTFAAVVVVAPLVPRPLAAQASSPPPTQAGAASSAGASLEGDVYLVVKSGDVKPAASNHVYLLQRAEFGEGVRQLCAMDPTLALRTRAELRRRLADSAMAQWRATHRSGLPDEATLTLQGAWVATRDSLRVADLDRPETMAQALYAGLALRARSAPTGMRARYRFDGVASGSYVLFASTALMDRRYYWYLEVVVPPGAAPLVRDLDNTAVREKPLECPS